MANNIQRNIIIGADAQQFYDAMRGINNQISHVDATLKRMDQDMMRNVASGHLLSQAIQDIGRAFVQYIQSAVESAQKLPPGINATADALRDARTEAEKLDVAIGVAYTDNLTAMERFYNKQKAILLEGGLLALLYQNMALPGGVTIGQMMEADGKAAADALDEVTQREEKILDQAQRYEKVQERLAKVAEKRAKEAQKAALAARNERLELEGIENIQRNEIEAMLAPKANTGINFEAEALLREGYDSSALADFNAEMERLGQLSTQTTEALQTQMEVAYSLQNAFSVIGATIASAFDTGNKALDAFLSALTQIGLQVIAKNLAISMSSAIKGAAEASAATGPAAPITLPVFIAAMTGVVATSFAGLTKMAHGGIVNKATPLIAGEAGPEAIIPLNQLNRMGGNLSARISGRDLLLLLEREQTVKARGYGQ